MKRNRLKLSRCTNCNTSLKGSDNFCCICGQENHDLKVPLKHLLLEVFESIFHFETKFFTTLKSIFTKPGQITRDFWEGKRARYMHPFRMYAFVSLIFFLIANKIADRKGHEIESSIQKIEKNQGVRIVELADLLTSANTESHVKALRFEDIEGIDLAIPLDSIRRRHFVFRLKQANNTTLDSLLSKKSFPKSVENRAKLRHVLAYIPDMTNIPTQLDVGPINIYFKTLEERDALIQNVGRYSSRKLDSLLVASEMKPNNFNRNLLKQVVKLNNKQENRMQNLVSASMSKLSLVMFVLMPVVALLLAIVFKRERRYYFEHLFFSVHTHTIFFILFIVALIINYFAQTDWLIIFFFSFGWVYFFISLKKVYQQGWLTTIYKLFLLSFFYTIIATLFIGGAIFWGFLTF